MKKIMIFASILCVCLYVSAAGAREIDKAGLRIMRMLHEDENPAFIDQGARDMKAASAVDTFCLVWYDFETMDWQGWEKLDNTAQRDTFWHVDDFEGLGGGDYGGLVALEGDRSMWCGTRPAGDSRTKAPFWYLCNWQDAPGYGNGWIQYLTTDAFSFTGILTISYKGHFDSEPDFDETYVEYDRGDDNWTELAVYDGLVDTVAVNTVLPNQVATKLRFRFDADGAWSDQDGLWDTDGGAIIDSITVSDASGLIDYEDWEGEDLDALVSDSGFWYASEAEPFGSYAGLMTGLVDKDPCGDNFATQIVFFQSSIYPSADYPGLFDTPFCKGEGNTTAPCQNESIMSPQIEYDLYSSNCDEIQDTPIPPAVLPDLGGTVLRYTVMRDLPLPNLVFYTWAVRSMIDGCPAEWKDRSFVYYGPEKDYIQSSFDISDLIGAYPMQVIIGVSDMCDVWFDSYGDCAAHTPAPWFDNVRVYKYSTVGPQWSYRDLDLFQDNFPGAEFDIESFVRADCANDLRANDDPVIDPGDSAVVSCNADYSGGLDTTSTGEARVYCHVWAEYIGTDGLKSDLYGPSLEGSYGTYVGDDGAQWTTFLCPVAITGGGNPAAGRYMIDLNDSLFTRGYQVNYYFKAYSFGGGSSCLPEDAETDGRWFEFTCLPTHNSGLLFVDDFHGRGTFEGTVQTYWDPALAAVVPGDAPDRYDVNSPSSLVSNGPGSRAKNYQMVNTYRVVIWDSGNLNSGTITEGTTWSDKSNDAQMLIDWMELSEHKVGLWVMGDGIAYDLDGSPAPSAIALLGTYCGVSLVNDSYFELTGGRTAGGIVNPQVTGVVASIYDGIQYYAFGGCPIINAFDVLEVSGTGAYTLRLPDYNSVQYYIGISNSGTNSAGYAMRTSWIGHSMMYVRNGGLQMPRNELLESTWNYFETETNEDITGETVPGRYALMQNYPNPFNPSTTIRFDLPRKGHVDLKIYNVAGQLVRVLTDQDWDAGHHSIDWNGRNQAGSRVASGVYFYKIEADSFESTKKMVLLR